MSDWPSLALTANTQLDTTCVFTSVTAHATANTKGSWTELVSSTAYVWNGFMLLLGASDTTTERLCDIAIGGSGSEVVIAANIHMSYTTTIRAMNAQVYVPLQIAAGSRISARIQASTGGFNMGITLLGLTHGYTGQILSTYGADTSDSAGLLVDPGGTANTYGSWVEFTSSTTYPINALCISVGNRANSAPTRTTHKIQVAIGGSGSEQVVIGSLDFGISTSDVLPAPQYSPMLPVHIPVGSRIAVRTQCDITDATDRLIDVILYGVS